MLWVPGSAPFPGIRKAVALGLPHRSSGEADHVPGSYLLEDPLEAEGRDVVALVDDDLPVAGDEVADLAFTVEALENADIDDSPCDCGRHTWAAAMSSRSTGRATA